MDKTEKGQNREWTKPIKDKTENGQNRERTKPRKDKTEKKFFDKFFFQEIFFQNFLFSEIFFDGTMTESDDLKYKTNSPEAHLYNATILLQSAGLFAMRQQFTKEGPKHHGTTKLL